MSAAGEDSYVEGFAVIPRAIQRDPNITPVCKVVYLALSSRANAQQRCWPSHQRIAEESGCSVATVKRSLEELRDRGLVSWLPDPDHGQPGRRPNRYQLGQPASYDVAQDELSRSSQRAITQPTVSYERKQLNESNRTNTAASADAEPLTLIAEDPQPPADRFEEFWRAYPRRVGKGAARKAWQVAVKTHDPAAVIAGARRFGARPHEARFTPHPATWLRAERWADEDDPFDPGEEEPAPRPRVDPPVDEIPEELWEPGRDDDRAVWKAAWRQRWYEANGYGR